MMNVIVSYCYFRAMLRIARWRCHSTSSVCLSDRPSV